MPRRLQLPRRLQIRSVFTPDMATQALSAARLSSKVQAVELSEVCVQVCFDFQSLLTALDDQRGQLKRIHAALTRISNGDLGYIAPWMRALGAPPKQNIIAWLNGAMTPLSTDPVISNLRSGVEYLECMVGQSLGSSGDISKPEDIVRTAASLAAESTGQGIKRADAEYFARSRQRAEQFAWSLIDCYVRISGRTASFSRQSATTQFDNEPSGPLIRFLTVAYAQLREAAVHDPLVTLPAEILSPKPETLVAWITGYRERLAEGESGTPN